jgi:hypothetical protein
VSDLRSQVFAKDALVATLRFRFEFAGRLFFVVACFFRATDTPHRGTFIVMAHRPQFIDLFFAIEAIESTKKRTELSGK